MSPFSAVISLKKSLIKDKFPSVSAPTSSNHEIAALASKNLMLEKKLTTLQRDHESAIDDCEAAHKTIRLLQTEPKLEKDTVSKGALLKELAEKNELINTLEFDNKHLKKENENLKVAVENLNENIQDLEISNKKQKEISNKFNKEINETKVQFGKEKEKAEKEHRAEVKSWRKDLGDEVKKNVKLEKTLKKYLEAGKDETLPVLNGSSAVSITPSINPLTASNPDNSSSSSSILCSICAIPIVNYVPKYFLGEKFNPACDKCDVDADEFNEDIDASDEVKSTPETNENIGIETPKEDIAKIESESKSDGMKVPNEVVNEDEEGFIGPKLPRRMTEEEKDEFLKELLEKYKFPS